MRMKMAVACCALVAFTGCTKQARMAIRADFGGTDAKREYALWLWTFGPERDTTEAKVLLAQLADAGDAESMYQLGSILAGGADSWGYHPETIRLFTKGAEAGHLQCMFALGAAYRCGYLGLERDEAKARIWLAKVEAIDRERSRAWRR